MAARDRPGGRGGGFGLALPLGLLCVAGYFGWAALEGEYGVFRGVDLEAEHAALEAELAALDGEADGLRARIRRLSDGFLDLDLLDERARLVLGLARADEIVVE